MLSEPWPFGAALPDGVMVNLAGVTSGDANTLAANVDLGLAGCEAARAAGVRHVFLCSSSAVYGRGSAKQHALGENDATHPANPYGKAKLRMEEEALEWASHPGRPGLTLLRIGNVLGADALIGGVQRGRIVTLDPVPGQPEGPMRSYIGPRGLARVLWRLAELAQAGAVLPPVLNIAAPLPVGMAELLEAGRISWQWGPDNPAVLARLVLDTTLLEALCPGLAGPGSPRALMQELELEGGTTR
jgi:nucleoside-diphosphate-sugar epimerase